MAGDSSSKDSSLSGRFARVLRLKPSGGSRLTKKPPPGRPIKALQEETTKKPSPLELHREKYKDNVIDSQLGERKDVTALLHGLTHRESFDSFKEQLLPSEERKPGEDMVASLSSELWDIIAKYLAPADAANLALASRTIHERLGSLYWDVLNLPENREEKIRFLTLMDVHLPFHLFCFPCAKYHVRIFPGDEKLKPPGVLNPLFICPNARSYALLPPRLRLTPSRNLPFTFVQLALRARRFSPEYGVSIDSLSRRWQESEWSHQTRYSVHNGHLLLRVISSSLAAPGLAPSMQRHLLYSREDYTPRFSVCAHWKNGNLMKLCKCALNHIPKPPDFNGPAGRFRNQTYNPNAPVRLCEKCRPMRRCPQCPTEYLIELRLVPDKSHGSFKRAIVVTRWSDLGDERSPYVAEWAACNGNVEYDSFAALSKRAISGTFESSYTEDQIPGQKILSLNPRGIIHVDGEDSDEESDWW